MAVASAVDGSINWARKWRPSTLDDYIGDAAKNKIISRIANANGEKPFSVLLLHGMRGGGKTSMSRLLSKELLCENPINGRACCKCDRCLEIDENLLFADNGAMTESIIEMNVAVDSGKSAIESTMEEMDTEPMFTKYKICILDEVQKASNAFQNALLKRLEEPKPYEIYILCTTNPEELITPIKSRCEVDIAIKPASVNELVDRLLYICEKEGVKTSKRALRMIANYTNRNPRESILKLEDIAKSNGMQVLEDDVKRETSNKDSEIYMEYYRAANNGLENILRFTNELKKQNIEYKEFMKGLTKFTLSCINLKFGIGLEDMSDTYTKNVKSFFNVYNADDIDCLLQIIEYANKMINSDETMSELIVNTTAMRISKIKLLAVGLQNELDEALAETKKGNAKSIELNKTEGELNSKEEVIDSALISSALGKGITEVKADIPIDIEDEPDESEVDRQATDDEIFKVLGIS